MSVYKNRKREIALEDLEWAADRALVAADPDFAESLGIAVPRPQFVDPVAQQIFYKMLQNQPQNALSMYGENMLQGQPHLLGGALGSQFRSSLGLGGLLGRLL